MTSQKTHLIRGIGTIGGALIVLNGMIGAGIFRLPSEIAQRAGVLSPWLFLGAGVLIIVVVLTMAGRDRSLRRRHPWVLSGSRSTQMSVMPRSSLSSAEH